jgi:hypothetical protein
MTMTVTTTITITITTNDDGHHYITTAPPTAAVSNCSWGGNGEQ